MTREKANSPPTFDSIKEELERAYQRIHALERALADQDNKRTLAPNDASTIELSEGFLKQAARMAKLGYAVWDDTLDKDVAISEELARIHGFTLDEYRETITSLDKYLELVLPQDREKYLKHDVNLQEDLSTKAASIEYRIRRTDGQIRYIQETSQYIAVPSGRPTQSLIVLQDITDKKEAELQAKKDKSDLEERETLLNQANELSNLGHAIWDEVNKRYEFVSDGWAAIFGYGVEEYLEKYSELQADMELTHPADRARYDSWYEKHNYKYVESVPDIEYRILRKDGDIRYLLERHKFISDELGKRTKSLSVIQDITEQKHAEFKIIESNQALTESETLLSQSAEMASLGYAQIDRVKHEFIRVSDNWAAIYGYEKEEFLAKFRELNGELELVHPSDRENFKSYVLKDSGDGVHQHEYRIIRRDGEVRDILERHLRLKGKDDQEEYGLSIIQDITKTKAAEKSLKAAVEEANRASELKSLFIANMSHEIRTPLNAILGAIGLLVETELTESQREYLKTSQTAGKSLLRIINDVLDTARVEAGLMEIEPSWFNVSALIQDVGEVFEFNAQEKSIWVHAVVGPDVPKWLYGDAGRIRQVYFNLLGNAIKFSDKGKITLKVEKADSDNLYRFSVADSGMGIPSDSHSEVFDKFTQIDPSLARKHEGSGLGLSICKLLVEAMQGSIDFESEKGVGSVFWFDLPLDSSNSDHREPDFSESKEKPHLFPGDEAIRILLAEDSPANQMIIRTYLETSGFQVDGVSNGIEAIKQAEKFPYDAILMDISMPEMDGLEATEILRKSEGLNSGVPVIALTAHALPEIKDKCLQVGMTTFLTKPISRADLLKALEDILDK